MKKIVDIVETREVDACDKCGGYTSNGMFSCVMMATRYYQFQCGEGPLSLTNGKLDTLPTREGILCRSCWEHMQAVWDETTVTA